MTRIPAEKGGLTKSRQDPPPRYSMTIHSLWPRRKLPLYCVTYELAHVLRTEISCCISWMSSSLDSRSIWEAIACRLAIVRLVSYGRIHTCLMATVSPVAFSMALKTMPKLPPAIPIRVSQCIFEIEARWNQSRAQLTAKFLQHLVVTGDTFVRHFVGNGDRSDRLTIKTLECAGAISQRCVRNSGQRRRRAGAAMFKQIDGMGIALRKSQFKAMESKPRSLVERREGLGSKDGKWLGRVHWMGSSRKLSGKSCNGGSDRRDWRFGNE